MWIQVGGTHEKGGLLELGKHCSRLGASAVSIVPLPRPLDDKNVSYLDPHTYIWFVKGSAVCQIMRALSTRVPDLSQKAGNVYARQGKGKDGGTLVDSMVVHLAWLNVR